MSGDGFPAAAGLRLIVGGLPGGGLPARPVFHEEVVGFLDALSGALLEGDVRRHPDVTAFALWCRRAAVETWRARFGDGTRCLGRGLVFHVCPANVPLVFAYSLAAGLLAGNANVVRLPSREFPEVAHLCERLGELLASPEHRALSGYVTCVRYEADAAECTRALSDRCDVRVVWGGDDTVAAVRAVPLPAGAQELVFPDRRSLAVVDAGAWLACRDRTRHVRGFHTDGYAAGQRACSSPLLVVWLGDEVEEARASFWSLLGELVAAGRQGASVDAVRGLEYACSLAARGRASAVSPRRDGIGRVWCDEPAPDLLDRHPGGGVFVETRVKRLADIVPLLDRKVQTLSYFGVPPDELADLLLDAGPRGVCRVVPLGRALDFSLIWDGHDLIRALSRRIDVVPEVNVR
ncbi:acyl-CoA reductase [Nonomuraea lactucae]|uniref:acyl-CoA reductase n=1 Tax=Nonomuraea lactucae TaxID=2249762 RepID=UPI000DE49F97|nr:acyl-CoA reductase [Nonomuraea lactucae]